VDVEFAANPPVYSRVRIVVCVCTLDRNEALVRCLRSLVGQKLSSDVDMQVLVIDNSANASARETVLAFEGRKRPVTYVREVERGIPAARNAALQALQEAQPAWIAFIDDDEVAPPEWLARMLHLALAHGADVVHGDVLSIDACDIEHAAQNWRGSHVMRSPKRTAKAATNNVLLRGWLVREPVALRFDTAMVTGGSDGEFFMRAADHGACIVHTKDASVFEERHPERETSHWKRRRAFRIGTNCNYRYRKNRAPSLLAAALIGGRAAERAVKGLNRMVLAACVLPINRVRARKCAQAGTLDFCFAWGCVAPYFGITSGRYYLMLVVAFA
jgi:succinoglycan biosynthesis protein ExoM